MSKRKASFRPRSQTPMSDSDDGEGPSQSSQVSKRGAGVSLNHDEKQNLVNDLVYYLIVADQKKVPVKRADITKLVLKEYAKAFAVIFSLAKEKLNKIFGMDVVEIESKKGHYILANKLGPDDGSNHLVNSEMDEEKLGLLMIVLSLIFMNGNSLPEAQLWNTLKSLGIDSEEQHLIFGDVKKLITQEFKSKGYIEMEKNLTMDPPSFQILWGPRSKSETTKMKVLKFVCLMYGDKEPEQWVDRYRDALGTEVSSSSRS